MRLRPVEESDLPAMIAIHGNPATHTHNPAGTPDAAACAASLNAWRAHWDAHGFGYWAAALHEDPHAVIGFGGVALKSIRGLPSLNLYFRFAPEMWGRGLATELAGAALKAAFASLPHDVVYGITRPENLGSIRTLTRAGMERVGEVQTDVGPPSVLFSIHRDALQIDS
ncbi:hypothetical protein IP84_05020 [beta proteobacterium AAP99]|nr:hypothetical protein IP84_05020 [beta proteobacterium AAP99]